MFVRICACRKSIFCGLALNFENPSQVIKNVWIHNFVAADSPSLPRHPCQGNNYIEQSGARSSIQPCKLVTRVSRMVTWSNLGTEIKSNVLVSNHWSRDARLQNQPRTNGFSNNTFDIRKRTFQMWWNGVFRSLIYTGIIYCMWDSFL